MLIHVENSQTDLAINTTLVKKVVETVLAVEGQKADEVAIYFVSGPEICRLHADFFDDPTITDCISFPATEPGLKYRHLGDVFVCCEVALAYAKEHKLEPLREAMLYVAHGVLHLLGYDDIEEEDEKAMRAAEQRVLARFDALGIG